jgi:hypothetical protein
VPYRMSDLLQVIDERMGKLENKRDLSPYRALKTRLESITLDPRYAFMFGSLTIYDSMAQILGRMFRVPVNNKPITILELTGLPTEIVNVVVSVLCRMTFILRSGAMARYRSPWCAKKHTATYGQSEFWVRTVQAGDRQDCQGRPQIRCLALYRHAAAGRNRSHHLITVQYRVCPAHVERPRPGNRQVGHCRYRRRPAGVPVRTRAARGHCLRRRRDPAGAHQVRRIAGARHAAQLQRPLHRDVAKIGWR